MKRESQTDILTALSHIKFPDGSTSKTSGFEFVILSGDTLLTDYHNNKTILVNTQNNNVTITLPELIATTRFVCTIVKIHEDNRLTVEGSANQTINDGANIYWDKKFGAVQFFPANLNWVSVAESNIPLDIEKTQLIKDDLEDQTTWQFTVGQKAALNGIYNFLFKYEQQDDTWNMDDAGDYTKEREDRIAFLGGQAEISSIALNVGHPYDDEALYDYDSNKIEIVDIGGGTKVARLKEQIQTVGIVDQEYDSEPIYTANGDIEVLDDKASLYFIDHKNVYGKEFNLVGSVPSNLLGESLNEWFRIGQITENETRGDATAIKLLDSCSMAKNVGTFSDKAAIWLEFSLNVVSLFNNPSGGYTTNLCQYPTDPGSPFASSSYNSMGSEKPAYYAFDGSPSTYWQNCCWDGAQPYPHYVGWVFAKPRRIRKINIALGSITSWSLMAGNSVGGATNVLCSGGAGGGEISFANDNFYTHYKLNITNGSAFVKVYTFEMFEEEQARDKVILTMSAGGGNAIKLLFSDSALAFQNDSGFTDIDSDFMIRDTADFQKLIFKLLLDGTTDAIQEVWGMNPGESDFTQLSGAIANSLFTGDAANDGDMKLELLGDGEIYYDYFKMGTTVREAASGLPTNNPDISLVNDVEVFGAIAPGALSFEANSDYPDMVDLKLENDSPSYLYYETGRDQMATTPNPWNIIGSGMGGEFRAISDYIDGRYRQGWGFYAPVDGSGNKWAHYSKNIGDLSLDQEYVILMQPWVRATANVEFHFYNGTHRMSIKYTAGSDTYWSYYNASTSQWVQIGGGGAWQYQIPYTGRDNSWTLYNEIRFNGATMNISYWEFKSNVIGTLTPGIGVTGVPDTSYPNGTLRMYAIYNTSNYCAAFTSYFKVQREDTVNHSDRLKYLLAFERSGIRKYYFFNKDGMDAGNTANEWIESAEQNRENFPPAYLNSGAEFDEGLQSLAGIGALQAGDKLNFNAFMDTDGNFETFLESAKILFNTNYYVDKPIIKKLSENHLDFPVAPLAFSFTTTPEAHGDLLRYGPVIDGFLYRHNGSVWVQTSESETLNTAQEMIDNVQQLIDDNLVIQGTTLDLAVQFLTDGVSQTSVDEAYIVGGSEYATDAGFYFHTNLNKIDISNWENINQLTITQTTPPDTTIIFMFSAEAAGTLVWRYWDGNQWLTEADPFSNNNQNLFANGNDKATIEALTRYEWHPLLQGKEELNMIVGLKTTDRNVRPQIDHVNIKFTYKDFNFGQQNGEVLVNKNGNTFFVKNISGQKMFELIFNLV
jgi:hypothetical protein